MIPIGFTKILTAANSTIVATSQARASSGSLTLSSGPPVVLDTQRRIQLVLTASNSGDVIVVSGTNDSGTPISETITVGATATTLVTSMDYKTITDITSTTLTGNIIAGTNSTGSTPWLMPSPYVTPQNVHVGVFLTASGAATYSAEYTMDIDPCGIRNNAPLTAVNALVATLMSGNTTSHSALINSDGTSNLPVPVTAWRLTITAGTGGAQVQALQAG